MKPITFSVPAAAFAACAAAFAVAVFALPLTAAHADTAILVGVNKYPQLSLEKQLEGCVNDAQSMRQSLKNQGFDKIVVLTDGEATHDRILRAIKNSGNKPNERFVFGFFGHGTNDNGRAVILPSDASMDGGDADLEADALRDAVAAVPASSRTIILDSCHSGGMVRSVKSLRPTARSRFVVRRTTKRNLPSSRGVDDLKDLKSKMRGTLCYVVAAAPNQSACEDVVDGTPHGVFTAALTKQLDASGTKSKTWGQVITDVRAAMSGTLQALQNPEISPSFSAVTIFGGVGQNTVVSSKPNTLWDLYNTDQRDENIIKLAIKPDLTTLPIASKDIVLSAQLGKISDGSFLVVVEKGTSGNYNLIYPLTPAINKAAVSGGKSIELGHFTADATGSEVIKALVFRSKETAQFLLDTFKLNPDGTPRPVPTLSRDDFNILLKQRDLKRNAPTIGDFTNADLTFEIVD